MSVAAPPQPPRNRRRLPVRLPRTARPLAGRETATPVEHLEELRWRLITCVATLFVTFIVAYAQHDRLFELLNRPLDGDFRIQTLGVTEPFFTAVTVAAHTAFAVTFPVLVWNCYRYIAPALQRAQRRALWPVLVASPVLFFGGVAFCYFVVLGPAVRFLLGLGAGSFDVAVRAQDYYGFVSTTVVAMGLLFQFPLLLLGLSRAGLLTAARLRANRKVALVLIAIVAALLPTADPVSLVIEMVPLLGLFELSVLLVALQERSLARTAARAARAGS